jgi:hypothetical protein
MKQIFRIFLYYLLVKTVDSDASSGGRKNSLDQELFAERKQVFPTSSTSFTTSETTQITTDPVGHHRYHTSYRPRLGPVAPQETPLRFLRACEGDLAQAEQRYKETLRWREKENIDTILREPFEDFWLIKKHYPHFYHCQGFQGEPVYYEQPAKTDLKALKAQGVTFEKLLRHYIMISEYEWQMLCRDDLKTSIFVVDLHGIRLSDFIGETVDFVKKASTIAVQHYPERAGKVFIVNVPRWFQLIWKTLRPLLPEATIEKIFILRGKHEIIESLQKHIPLCNIPPEYGGKSPTRLGDSPEEVQLTKLMQHNMQLAKKNMSLCPGCHPKQSISDWPCDICAWKPARRY